jgi:plastocyanin
MKFGRWSVAALLVACSARAALPPPPTGRIEGKVTLLEGGRPRADASNVVVWIEATKVDDRPASALTMTSEHKRFTPRVVAVEAGRAVTFPNQDPIFHNVFSVSGENKFDLGLYRSGRSKERTFAAPGLVRVYCNIHPQMVGYVRVVDSSFFTVTGVDGAFAFDGVPTGSRVVRAWCEPGGETSGPVVVRSRQTTPAALSFDVSTFKPQPHKNKYGQDYPPPPPDEDRY